MLCQKCKEKQASTHIKTITDGQLRELHLCNACAVKEGYANAFYHFDIGSLLSGLLGESSAKTKATRCSKCGASFEEIAQRGKVGCAQCYHTFDSQLLPMIRKIHGAVIHKGKRPGGSSLRVQDEKRQMMLLHKTTLEKKQQALKQAIAQQDFEQAAVLRDQIKELMSDESH